MSVWGGCDIVLLGTDPGGDDHRRMPDPCMPPREAEHAAIVRHFLTDVVGRGDTDAIDGLLGEDVRVHEPGCRSASGFEGMNGFISGVLAAGDLDIDIESVVAEADRVAVLARLSGHLDGLSTVSTGDRRHFETEVVSFYHLEDGKIVELWLLVDRLGLASELLGDIEVDGVSGDADSDDNHDT